MMIDASAFVAILTDEPEGPVLSERLSMARTPLTTPIALFESALGIARKRSIAPTDARVVLDELVELVGITEVPITPEIGERAIAAFAAYGKGTGHPAQLNLGDCFAYAAARVHCVPLLFKGEDFARTDIPRA
jgi:ribonuclease VapC